MFPPPAAVPLDECLALCSKLQGDGPQNWKDITELSVVLLYCASRAGEGKSATKPSPQDQPPCVLTRGQVADLLGTLHPGSGRASPPIMPWASIFVVLTEILTNWLKHTGLKRE